MNRLYSSDIFNIANLVVNSGWDSGVRKYFIECSNNSKYLEMYDIDSFFQGAWSTFIGHSRKNKVLTIDSNIGATSIIISKNVGKLISLQPSIGVGKAVVSRIQSERTGQVSVAIGNLSTGLPFRDGTFDMVCIHCLESVIELFCRHGIDFNFLMSEIDRVLATCGTIYISGKNKSIIGSNNKSKYLSVYKLLGCKFSKIWKIDVLFDSYPDIHKPELLRVSYPVTDRVNIINLLKGFLYSKNYGVLFHRKRDDQKKTKDNLTLVGNNMIKERENFNNDNMIYLGRKGVLLLKRKDRIVRVPLTERGFLACKDNYNALSFLKTIDINIATPKPLEYSIIPVPSFSEERIPGKEIKYAKCGRRELIKHQIKGIELLENMKTGRIEYVKIDNTFLDNCVSHGFQLIIDGGIGEEKEKLMRLKGNFYECLLGKIVPCSIGHGDFKITNILVNNRNKITGLVDWDGFQRVFPVPIDSIMFLSYNLSLSCPANGWFLSSLYLTENNHCATLLKEHMFRLGIMCDNVDIYVILTALYLAKYTGVRYLYVNSWREKNLRQFVDLVEKYIKYYKENDNSLI